MKKNDPELVQAQDASTTPVVLEKHATSKNKAVRREVAKNPNTPIEALYTLGAEFPEEFLSNPVLPLLLLEDPQLVEKIPPKTMSKLLQVEDVPDFFLEKLSEDALQAALRLRKLPEKIIRCIWKHYQEGRYGTYAPARREKIAAHPSTPADILLALSKHPKGPSMDSRELWERIAAHPNAPTEALERLIVRNISSMVPINITQNPNTNEELLWKLRTSECGGFNGRGRFPEWESFLAALSFDTATISPTARNLSREQQERLLKGGIRAKLFVASDTNCPEPILRELAFDPIYEDWELLSLILGHPNTTTELLDGMYTSERHSAELNQQIRRAIAASTKAGEALLEKLSHDPDDRLRRIIIQNGQLPYSCLERMAKHDEDPYTRAEAAQNPAITEELLALMVRDKDSRVQLEAVLHPLCPREERLRLAKTSDDITLIYKIIHHKSTTAEMFQCLQENQHWQGDTRQRHAFKSAMKNHPMFPAGLLPWLNLKT